MREAWILDYARTPFGKRDGILRSWHPVDLAAHVLEALVERNGIRLEEIDDVLLGCVTATGEQGLNIARMAALAAGFPVNVPGVTVNRMCGSGLQACHFAAEAILSGQADLVLAGGVESMTRAPLGSDAGPISSRVLDRFDLVPQGNAAEFMADRWRLTRRELDEFSFESHRRALAADFSNEIVPTGGIAKDEGPRSDTSLEKMLALKPAFREGGVITAGNSSQISDGAAAVVMASPEAARRLGRPPRARFLAGAVVGVDPTMMLTGPIPATRMALRKAGLEISEIDLFECNEAFAPVPLVWMREMGVEAARVNVNGGAIALGHPVGATGARLIGTLICNLEKRGLRRGLATLCIGLGQGIASIWERV